MTTPYSWKSSNSVTFRIRDKDVVDASSVWDMLTNPGGDKVVRAEYSRENTCVVGSVTVEDHLTIDEWKRLLWSNDLDITPVDGSEERTWTLTSGSNTYEREWTDTWILKKVERGWTYRDFLEHDIIKCDRNRDVINRLTEAVDRVNSKSG